MHRSYDLKAIPSLRFLCLTFVLLAASITLLHPGLSVSGRTGTTLFGQDPPGSRVYRDLAGDRLAVVDVIESGEKLEKRGLWADALDLYERAEKEHGQSAQIHEKLVNARTHFDVQRRYADLGYIQTVQSTPVPTSQNILSEVLHKIESYYVNNPEWVALVRQGLANVDVALYDPGFRRQHLSHVNEATVNYASQRIHQIAQKFRVGSRINAYDFAMAVSQSLENDLGITRQAILFEFINGATTALDPYSSFLTGDQYADVMSQIEGNFVGLGIEIRPTKETLQIISVIPGGPAERHGLRSGDFVRIIDRQRIDVVGGEQGSELLKGPENSVVELEIDRNGEKFSTRILRQRVDIPSLTEVAIIDRENGIGYIKLANFQKTTANQFENALWGLHRKGLKSLIVDVRGNPGGLLTSSVDIADLFVDAGVLVSTKGRNPREDFVHQARREGTWHSLPVTVLVDRNSASASEIFAGAMGDLNRATIVGETSYGKGSVQGIFPLTMGRGGIRLTTAKFYSPSGKAISDQGVKPDVQIQQVKKPSMNLIGGPQTLETGDLNDDFALRAALSVAKQKLQKKNAG